LKDFAGDILSIPGADLQETIGTTSWDTQIEINRSGRVIAFDEVASHFVLTRYQRWIISTPPVHYPDPETYDITIVTGYDVSQRHQIEDSLSLSITAGSAANGLSATAKADLKITDTTTETWHEQSSFAQHQKFDADTTYVFWSLMDCLHLVKTSVVTHTYSTNRIPDGTDPPLTTENYFNCVLSIYGDKLSDVHTQNLPGRKPIPVNDFRKPPYQETA